MSKLKDLTGKRYGRLVVIGRDKDYISPTGRKIVRWKCQCDCGNTVSTTAIHLTNGDTLSCGCYGTERRRKSISSRNLRHEKSRTRIYHLYQNMKYRCYNSGAANYSAYGGRGIRICDEWLGENGFENFFNWSISNGYRDDLSIDRIDVNGNYSPENCRWADEEVQHNNTQRSVRLTLEGRTQTAAQWAKELGVDRHTIYDRLRKGKPLEEVLKPSNRKK